jgi:mannose-6-phosphate isomerase-like protein (cupin superfamily)
LLLGPKAARQIAAKSEVPLRFDPSEIYAHLATGGTATTLPGGERFWSQPESELEQLGHGWLITEFEFDSDWPNWEMHPGADEFVYLLSGAVVLLLEEPAGTREVPLSGRGAAIVPKGTWHTARVSQPSRMLFVTMGHGTQQRVV